MAGRLTFQDFNPDSGQNVSRSLSGIKTEVWRYGRRGSNGPQWALEATTTTDSNGRLSVVLPFLTTNATCALKVFAENEAAVVWTMDNGASGPYARHVGEDDGTNRVLKAGRADAVLDFTYEFRSVSAMHFNLADTVLAGFVYAQARRDPAETDPLGKANVWPASNTVYGKSYFDHASDTLVVLTNEAWMDFLVLHEYAHFLEKQISVFAPIYALHDGCEARLLDGMQVNSPEHAWMEAFANFFAIAVGVNAPAGSLSGWGTTYPPWVLEPQPMDCPQLPPDVPSDAIEAHVSGALWDLLDQPGDLGVDEPYDTLARMDLAIMQIFDKELDVSGRQPTIAWFRDAWLARGLPREELQAIWEAHRLSWQEPVRIICPEDLTFTAPTGKCQLVVDYPAPTLISESPETVVQCTPASGSSFPLGTTVVQCVATNQDGLVAECSFQVEVRGGSLLPPGSGTGLLGAYYDHFDFTDPKLTRGDTEINFDWGENAPLLTMQPDRYSVRWRGELLPRNSGLLTFYTVSDDGVRLWVGGQLVIDNWTDHTETEDSGSLVVDAGRRYEILLEYYQHWGPAKLILYWAAECLPREVIPQSQLFPFPELRIQEIHRQNNSVTLVWNSRPGKQYRVQATTGLGGASWVEVDGPLTAEGESMTRVLTVANDPMLQFFRVTELP